jgi:hypothetical protein
LTARCIVKTTLSIFGALLVALTSAACTAAEERETAGETAASVWGVDPEASSAVLARDGWKFLSMSTMSWPDGSQAVVTLWNSDLGDFARCFDYFDPAMNQTGGKCERSGTGL